MDIRKIGAIKEGDSVIGHRTKVKIVKNKIAPPFRNVEFDIMFGLGISKSGDLLDLAVETGIVEKAGAWFSYNNAKVGQGRENSKRFLEENPDITQEIKTKILVKKGLLKDNHDNQPSVNQDTGEILDAEIKPAKKTSTRSKKKVQ